MTLSQQGILAPVPPASRYLTFRAKHQCDIQAALRALNELADGEKLVVGIGKALLLQLAITKPALPNFPSYTNAGIQIPSTPADLWCWLRGDERGELLLRSQSLIDSLAQAFECVSIIDGFCHQQGRDLTGYEDGTENPVDDAAIAAAIVSNQGEGLDGGSFVAVQQWLHDMTTFKAMSGEAQDNMMGRRRSDNEELDDAPKSAHVKRTAQESFSPEAFVVRRSMSWSEGQRGGLVFVSFGHSLQGFAAQLRRMVGLEDSITDSLFQFTRPITGAYFWCPPLKNGRLNFTAIK
ncbi:Dyp-type peroxidase [Moraxellaceae bacterium AER2_44_116]|nr:Dyp-type peroxidase [Moraxellaceae bacterium]TQC99227.1 Dyp-type peroxidase [Moraxellaceae bacterium AER2_44_116]